ncbi:type VI secretion system tip protein VgrG [Escherichia coli]
MGIQNFDHSHHKLKIRGLQSPVDVLTFTGREQLNAPFRYDIEFTSTDKAITPESVLMQDGAFSLTAPPVQGMPVMTPLRTLYGVITGFKHLSSSQDEARYEVRLEPRMALLTRSRQNAIYQNLTVPQIVEKILRERHQMRGQDFVFNLKSEYPAREQVMQYGEDDLTFVSRLLSEVGIWFRFATDARLKIEVIEFYDDQSGYERGLTLPLRHPSGLHDGATEAVWGLNTAYSVVEKSVSTRDYNYRTATAEMMTEQHDATGGDNTTYGEAYHYADNFLQKGDKEAAESGAFYARIRHERYLNEQAILKGQSTSSLLMPGLEIRIQGDDAPAVFRKGVLVTGVTASAARDRSYELTFTAIPYSERYGYRPALIPRPVMAGTLPARVTSTVKNDIYAHIDKDGRYRVNLDFDRDTWKPGYESLWVRQSRPYAGDTYGLHLPLLLERLPGLENLAWNDGTPFADEVTRNWIAQQVMMREDGAWLAGKAAVPTDDAINDVLALEPEALEMADSQGVEAALGWIQTRPGITTARQRLLLRLLMARVAEQYGKNEMALLLLEELDTAAQGITLTQWEPELLFEVKARQLKLLRLRAHRYADKALLNRKMEILLGTLVTIDPVRAAVLCDSQHKE